MIENLENNNNHLKPENEPLRSNAEDSLLSIENNYSKKATVAGWLIISAATVGSGLSAWVVVEGFQQNDNFCDPTPAKVITGTVLAATTHVGTIFSRRTE